MDNHDPRWRIELFFDGECPLCAREINMMRKLDRGGLVRFTDIARLAPNTVDLPPQTDLMKRIHARTQDGEWITGVEVFRRIYGELGFRRLVRLSRIAPIDFVLRQAYEIFARNRLRWTGRCEDNVCELPRAQTH